MKILKAMKTSNPCQLIRVSDIRLPRVVWKNHMNLKLRHQQWEIIRRRRRSFRYWRRH
jgi:hypothetical protein